MRPSAALALLLAVAARTPAQNTRADSIAAAGAKRLDSLIVANSRTMTMGPAGLQGPGADFLSREIHDAQFVALGEQHGLKEVPQFAEILLRTVQASESFQFYA